jgi:sec-independent protein translocase protein TatC
MKFMSMGRGPAEMPFLDHLEELRWRILWSLLALMVATIIGFVLVLQFDVVGILNRPVQGYLPDGKLTALRVTDGFFITIQLGLTVGVVLAAPIVIYQIWAFLSPALLPRERRAIVPSFYFGLILFLAGAAFAYFLVLPMSVRFLMTFNTEHLSMMPTASEYFGFVIKLLLLFGFVFELPVVVLVLSVMGLVTASFLRSKRRYAIAAMAVGSALITPGDVVAVTLFLMVPLVLLYELSIFIALFVERSREKRARLEAEAESAAAQAAESSVPQAVEGA